MWLDGVGRDLAFAVRRLSKDRWVTLGAVVAIALGIGANTAVFAIAKTVLFGSLPFDQPEKIMWLDTRDLRGRTLGVSLQDFEDWRRTSRTLSGMALASRGGFALSENNRPAVQFPGVFISAIGFKIIGQNAALGRTFREEDDQPGAKSVVLLSTGVWESLYAADPSIVGKIVRVNSIPSTVIGVMPAGFAFPADTHVWLPMSQLPPAFQRRGRQARFFFAYGRLADGMTLEQSRSEFSTISAQLAQQHQDTNKDISAVVTPFVERAIDPQIRTISWALVGAAAFVLLIACSNVANLLLSGAAARAREIAVRTALGATRGRLARQLFIESLVMSSVGAAIGLGLAVMMIRWFDLNTQDVGKPYWMVFTLDARVLAFFAGVSVLTAILFGLAPTMHISKTNAYEVLKDGGRSVAGGLRARRWTGALIVAELALSLMLLSGAGFMMQSFLKLYRMEIGADTSQLLTMQLFLPSRKYTGLEDVVSFLRRVDDRLNAIGSIEAASTTTSLPLFGIDSRQLAVDGRPMAADEAPPIVVMLSVGPRYFDALGVKLVRGRPLTESDGEPGQEVAVINQRAADMYFPNEDPVGRRIRLFDETQAALPWPWATIVGVAPTVKQRSLQEAPIPDPVVYIPHAQNLTHRNGTLVIVRARSDPGQLTAQLRQEIFALDPDMPLANIHTMDHLLAQQRWSSRIFGAMFGVFAVIAVVLAGVGLYAVTAFGVTQRTSEFGVRIALGAEAGHIVWLVVRRAVIHLAVGFGIGLAGAVGIGHLLAAVLVETSPTDSATLATSAGVVVLATAVACLWPIRRAIRLDPVVALRCE